MTAKAIPADPFIVVNRRLNDALNRQAALIARFKTASPEELELARPHWEAINAEAEALLAEMDRLIEGENLH